MKKEAGRYFLFGVLVLLVVGGIAFILFEERINFSPRGIRSSSLCGEIDVRVERQIMSGVGTDEGRAGLIRELEGCGVERSFSSEKGSVPMMDEEECEYAPIGDCVRCPDVDGNGLIGGGDLSLLAGAISFCEGEEECLCEGEEGYVETYDLDGDGCIDQDDYDYCFVPFWNIPPLDLSTCCNECPPDLNLDGEVGPGDLAHLLGNWGDCDSWCPEDFNGDGIVGPGDLAHLWGQWGPCEEAGDTECSDLEDNDGDGLEDGDDEGCLGLPIEPDESTVLLMHMGDDVQGSGEQVLDSSGNGNHGATFGVDCTKSGKIDLGCEFDGVEDEIIVPDSSSLDIGSDEITIMLWVFVEECANQDSLINKGNTYSMIVSHDCLFRPTIYINTDGDIWYEDVVRIFDAGEISVGEWHHLAISYGEDTLRAYIDGNENSGVAFGDPGIIAQNDEDLLIGNEMDMKLDEVAIFNRALTAGEILEIYQANLNGYNSVDEDETNCGDGVCDGWETFESCSEDCVQCQDGVDNDGDGFNDLNDAGCEHSLDDDETNCGDGICEGSEVYGSCVDCSEEIWSEEKITPSDPYSWMFGYAVSVDGDVAVVGDPYYQVDGSSANTVGAVYVYRYDGSEWIEEQMITVTGGENQDYFGKSVSVYGDLIVVGAPGEDHTAEDAGGVYVYRYNDVDWILEDRLYTNAAPASEDEFGFSVDVFENTIVVGAHQEGDGNSVMKGYVHIFEYDGGEWIRTEKLQGEDVDTYERFGNSVSIDGDLIVVGCAGNDGDEGGAYVYRYNGGDWVYEVKLFLIDAEWNDFFGRSVAVSKDSAFGDVIIVGADSYEGSGPHIGSVFIYRYIGGEWGLDAELFSMDPVDGTYGETVGISGDLALVGAYYGHDDSRGTPGTAFLYRYGGGDVYKEWYLEKKLLASDRDNFDHFGFSVAIDDNVAIAGAKKNGNDGAAYIFEY